MWTRLTLFAAVIAGVTIRCRDVTYRHVARGLAVLFVIDTTRLFTARRPATFGLDVALTLAWYVAQTWTVWLAFFPRAKALATLSAVIAWGITLAALLSAQAPRGASLERAWTVVYLLATGTQAVAIVLHKPFSKRTRSHTSHLSSGVGMWLAISSVSDVVGPWIDARPVRDWYAGRGPAILTWVGIAAWEAVAEWRVGRRKCACWWRKGLSWLFWRPGR